MAGSQESPQLTVAAKQRTTLATRPLIEALADESGLAFTVNSSNAPDRSQSLIEKWKHTFTTRNRRRQFAASLFKFMVTGNRPDFSADDRWLPVRPLGAGSFGAVGLFDHLDENWEVDDCVVAKYAQQSDSLAACRGVISISQEAAIMIQLNEISDGSGEGVLFLRNYRHYADAQLWLHLLEYCPGLNLEALLLTYKAMRRTIPEAFLWYILYALAKGLVAMELERFGEDFEPTTHRPGAFLVHRDMKPENTFLGFPQCEKDVKKVFPSATDQVTKTILTYPHAKIADFGLSQITTRDEPSNVAGEHFLVGSTVWRPPEMRPEQLARDDEDFYPFANNCFDEDGKKMPQIDIAGHYSHAYTPAGNTFVVGFMMYQLMTLEEPDGFDELVHRILNKKEPMPEGSILDVDSIERRIAELATTEGADTEELRQRNLVIWTLTKFRDAPYSNTLKDMVEDCLMLRPEDRVGAVNLLKEVEIYMKQYLNVASRKPGFEEESIAYACQEDLGLMEPGYESDGRDSDFWTQLLAAYKWLDPERGLIRPDLDGPNVPDEVVQLFTPGMREDRNKNVLKRTRGGDGDSHARRRPLNPALRNHQPSEELVDTIFYVESPDAGEDLLDDDAPVAELRLSNDDSPVAEFRLSSAGSPVVPASVSG